jgi:hypothetical protein
MKRRCSVWLWLFSAWVLGMGIVNLWRCFVLWQERRVLLALDSSFTPLSLYMFVVLWFVCGIGLVGSAVGLWLRRGLAWHLARIGIVFSVLIFQTYLWFFVRSGLLQQRRLILLIVGLLTILVGVGALSYPRSRRWLKLGG